MDDHVEPILEPEIQIVDAHHHLWFLPDATLIALETRNSVAARAIAPTYRRHSRYLLDEFLADSQSGHQICSTVFVDANAMYRRNGQGAMDSLGEVEFARGVAAMASSGVFGNVRVCAAIVGGIDLRLGDQVASVLSAQLQAGGVRYRGVRSRPIAYDEDETILGPESSTPHILLDSKFREGFKWLKPLGLSFDVFLFEPQLPELIDLARAFPETQIVLDHVGTPLGVGRYTGKRHERFTFWRNQIRTLANSPNVAVKLGGLGMGFGGFDSFSSARQPTSEQLASEWKPYIETCIEFFGANRCMFVSNFPIDAATCSYRVLWNVFKRLSVHASVDEKSALFGGTARRIYKLDESP